MIAATLELLHERGAGRLTTREVAVRAGVSEGSVFYHFTDRTGLLTAAIEDGLAGLKSVGERGIEGTSVAAAIDRFTLAVEAFLDRALLVMFAAQSDAELRTGLADYLVSNNLGPHRGVQALGDYLRDEQARGTVRTDVDPHAVALMVVSASFMWASQQQMISPEYSAQLPGREAVVEALSTMLRPPAAPAEEPSPGG